MSEILLCSNKLHRATRAVQQFYECASASGPLAREREWLEQEVNKRICSLQAKTGNTKADVLHLKDSEYVELMVRHEDNMERQVKMMLVDRDPPGFSKVSKAVKAMARIKQEVLSHTHDHADSLLKFSKLSVEVSKTLSSRPSGVPLLSMWWVHPSFCEYCAIGRSDMADGYIPMTLVCFEAWCTSSWDACVQLGLKGLLHC
jgi:hypothetical protein